MDLLCLRHTVKAHLLERLEYVTQVSPIVCLHKLVFFFFFPDNIVRCMHLQIYFSVLPVELDEFFRQSMERLKSNEQHLWREDWWEHHSPIARSYSWCKDTSAMFFCLQIKECEISCTSFICITWPCLSGTTQTNGKLLLRSRSLTLYQLWIIPIKTFCKKCGEEIKSASQLAARDYMNCRNPWEFFPARLVEGEQLHTFLCEGDLYTCPLVFFDPNYWSPNCSFFLFHV